MGQPAARQNDAVSAVDVHIVMVPSPGGPVPTPLPHSFSGQLLESVSTNVLIDGLPAATVGTVARNLPSHLPTPPGTVFQVSPMNQGSVQVGSVTVQINGKAAARQGDPVATCTDVPGPPTGTITMGSPRVLIG